MPFEPLKTDEPRKMGQEKRQKEFEGQMLKGSLIIGLVAVSVFILCGWPFLTIQEYRVSGLLFWALAGALPAFIVGTLASWRYKLAGASGFAGGALTAGVFIHFRMDFSLLRGFVPDIPQAEYPDNWKWLIPAVWLILCLIVSFLFGSSDKDFDSDSPRTPEE
jgi:hypothetical protein